MTGFGGGGVSVESGGEVDDNVTISMPTTDSLRVASPSLVEAQGLCVQAQGGTRVDCPIAAGALLMVNLFFGSDTLDATTLTRDISVFMSDGNDTVLTGSGDDAVVANGAGSQVFAAAGTDRLAGDTATTVLRGQTGNDELEGAAILDGGPGDDDLRGGPYGPSGTCAVASGGDGTDSIVFQSAQRVAISLDGVANDGEIGGFRSCNVGSDVEILNGGYLDDVLSGDGGPQRIDGAGGDDELRGLGGDDTLVGGLGSDTLDGGAGDDVFDEGPDSRSSDFYSDTMTGGAGFDTADYGARTGAVVVDTDGVADDGNPPLEHDNVLPDVEQVVGGAGDDELTGAAGAGKLDGGAGDDMLDGGAGDDILLGGVGDDTLVGGAGADELLGGPGAADVVDYSASTAGVAVDLDGDAGDDGAPGEHDTVGADVEDVVGGAGADTLTGNNSGNALDGAGGDDVLNGLAGDDRLRGGPGDDELNGGAGTDTADYSERIEPVEVSLDGAPGDGAANESDDVGPDGDVENVAGGSDDDILSGDGGPNLLDGGAGDDVLDGDLGADALVGGPGYDVAAYLERTAPVTLAIDGAPDSGGTLDGPPGARDVIAHDVEALWGGAAADHLTGDAGDNALYGGDGADVLIGGGGDDAADYSDRTTGVTVVPDDRPDSGNAADGAPDARDTVSSDIEDIYGGLGNDTLSGSASPNFIDAGAGDDLVDVRAGGDDVAVCGRGRDTALADDEDEVDASCETVNPSTAPQSSQQPVATRVATPSPLSPSADTTPPRAKLSLVAGQNLPRVLARGLRLRVTCSELCTLTAQLHLNARSARALGLTRSHRSVLVGAGHAASAGQLVLRLTEKARRALRRRSRVRLVVTIRASDPASNRSTVRRTITLSRTRATAAASVLAGAVRLEAPPLPSR